MEKIIRNEYEKGFNKDNETNKKIIKDTNRAKIKEALKIAGFSEKGKSLYKYGFIEDTANSNNKGFLGFSTKDGIYCCSDGFALGYEITYDYNLNDSVIISIHGRPDVTYEFRNIRVPDEIMLVAGEVKEKFIDFLDEKLNTIKDNLDFSNYQKIVEILK